jgi:Fe-S-cluster-containing hydrogenase component 2
MKIKWISKNCYACRSCQLICSFHHTGRFWPEKSSIDLYRKPAKGVIVWKIDQSCDMCEQEPQLQCVRYCKYDALQIRDE